LAKKNSYFFHKCLAVIPSEAGGEVEKSLDTAREVSTALEMAEKESESANSRLTPASARCSPRMRMKPF
ncbi:MAG: hypothetical protein DME74_11430, partial [Verrucomicrobia bacterium]